jgi:hypothetical protein
VLASADQIPALADLDAQPPVLIERPQGPWAAALRLRLTVRISVDEAEV